MGKFKNTNNILLVHDIKDNHLRLEFLSKNGFTQYKIDMPVKEIIKLEEEFAKQLKQEKYEIICENCGNTQKNFKKTY